MNQTVNMEIFKTLELLEYNETIWNTPFDESLTTSEVSAKKARARQEWLGGQERLASIVVELCRMVDESTANLLLNCAHKF